MVEHPLLSWIFAAISGSYTEIMNFLRAIGATLPTEKMNLVSVDDVAFSKEIKSSPRRNS